MIPGIIVFNKAYELLPGEPNMAKIYISFVGEDWTGSVIDIDMESNPFTGTKILDLTEFLVDTWYHQVWFSKEGELGNGRSNIIHVFLT